MCIAIPSKVVEISGVMATVDANGVTKEVSLAMVDDVKVGDYLIVHIGYAVRRLSLEEAESTLMLFREITGQIGIAWQEGLS